jgi:hypothetical protein
MRASHLLFQVGATVVWVVAWLFPLEYMDMDLLTDLADKDLRSERISAHLGEAHLEGQDQPSQWNHSRLDPRRRKVGP